MRPEGRQQLGFVPMDLRAVDLVCEHLAVAPDAVLLDPCAGTGEAADRFAENLGIDQSRLVVAELDRIRSEKLRERFPESRVTESVDSLAASSSKIRAASLLYLNPPFDSDGANGRLELSFLSHCGHWLRYGGVLVFVVPRRHIRGGFLKTHLWNCYDQVTALDLPSSLAKYGECVVFGYRRSVPKTGDNYTLGFLRPNEPVGIYQVPAGEPFEIVKRFYTDDELGDLMDNASACRLMFGEHREQRKVRPPLELGHGHRALLLAAGHLNGRIRKPGELPHVVRGISRKRDKQKSKEKTGKTTTTVVEEQIDLVIRTVNIRGEFEEISDAQS